MSSESTIYKPSIYNGPTVYNNGGGGGGGGEDLPIGYFDGYLTAPDGKIYPYIILKDSNNKSYAILTENLDYAWDGLQLGSFYHDNGDRGQYAVYYNNSDEYGWNGTKSGLFYSGDALVYLRYNSEAIFGEGWSTLNYTAATLIRDNAINNNSQSYKVKSIIGWKSGNGTTPTNETKLNIRPSGKVDLHWSVNKYDYLIFSGFGEKTTIAGDFIRTGGRAGKWITLDYDNDNISYSSGNWSMSIMYNTRLFKYLG